VGIKPIQSVVNSHCGATKSTLTFPAVRQHWKRSIICQKRPPWSTGSLRAWSLPCYRYKTILLGDRDTCVNNLPLCCYLKAERERSIVQMAIFSVNLSQLLSAKGHERNFINQSILRDRCSS